MTYQKAPTKTQMVTSYAQKRAQCLGGGSGDWSVSESQARCGVGSLLCVRVGSLLCLCVVSLLCVHVKSRSRTNI